MNNTSLKNTQILIDWANKQKKQKKQKKPGKKQITKDDINKLKINDKSDLNLNDLNSMYEQVQNALKKQDALNPIICDSKCKANKKENELYDKYVLAKSNYDKSPEEYSDARKNYYMYSKGGDWYSNFLFKESETTINKTVDEYNNKLNDKINSINNSISAYNIHKKFASSVNNLHSIQKNNASDINKKIMDTKNEVNINERLTQYYHQQIVYINRFIQVFKYIYWFLVVLVMVFIIILQKKYKNFKILLVSILFIIFPYILDRVIYYIYAYTTNPDHSILK